jgi:hypothetical protein
MFPRYPWASGTSIMARAKRAGGPWVCFDRRQERRHPTRPDAAPSPRASTHGSFHTPPHVVVVGRWERAAAGPRRRARDAAHQQTTHLRRGAGPGGKTVTAPRATPATWEGADVRDHVVASVRCHSLTGFGVRSVYSTVPCPTHTFLISLLMSPGQKKTCSQGRSLSCPPATQRLSCRVVPARPRYSYSAPYTCTACSQTVDHCRMGTSKIVDFVLCCYHY